MLRCYCSEAPTASVLYKIKKFKKRFAYERTLIRKRGWGCWDIQTKVLEKQVFVSAIFSPTAISRAKITLIRSSAKSVSEK